MPAIPTTSNNTTIFDRRTIDPRLLATMPERKVFTRRWLEDFPAELRLKIYKNFFEDACFTLHACPNPEYTFENSKTSHDFIYPNCHKSSKETTAEEHRQSRKNLLLVSKTVKEEAYEFFLSESRFVLDSESCMTDAFFLQYRPIKHMCWNIANAPTAVMVAKLGDITKQYANRCALRWLGTAWCFDFTTADLFTKDDSHAIFGAILSSVKAINAETVELILEKWQPQPEPDAQSQGDGTEDDGDDQEDEDDEDGDDEEGEEEESKLEDEEETKEEKEEEEGVANGVETEEEIYLHDAIFITLRNPTQDPTSWVMHISVNHFNDFGRLVPHIVLAHTTPWSATSLSVPDYVINGNLEIFMNVRHGLLSGRPLPRRPPLHMRWDMRVNRVKML